MEQRRSALYRLGALPFRAYRRLTRGGSEGLPGGDFYSGEPRLLGSEVRAALAGRYGATTRISEGQASVTLYTAIPIRWNRRVLGAVLVSRSTLGILAMLDEVRIDIFRVVLASLAVAAVLSLLVSTTIARPLGRLRAEASQIVDERGRLQRSFTGSQRRGRDRRLSRALEQLTLRLRDHVRFIESFASDVSHEFKNPLAAIRSAAELLADSRGLQDRERMLAIVLKEVSRMERMLTGVRDVTRLDAGAADEANELVDLAQVVGVAVESASLQTRRDVRIELAEPPTGATWVRGSSESLVQVVSNLLDNAAGFAPDGSAVCVELGTDGGWATIAVSDGGPGVPPEHRQRIFDRFFSFRPVSDNGVGHVGLGLSIAQPIARDHGGDIAVGELPGVGARFEVRLPRA